MESNVHNLDAFKLKTVSIDLKKLSAIVDKEVLKKSEYNINKQLLDKKYRMSADYLLMLILL